MFIKLTRAGGHSYAQLVESFRNEEGKPRQRTLATLGRLDETEGAVHSLLNGLMRATGRQPLAAIAPPQVQFESALVAVGTEVTPRPPHRSVRAALPHTAPASGM